MQAGDAVAVIYTYLVEDKHALGAVVDRVNLWHATGWRHATTKEPLPWVPNEITGGRPELDKRIGLALPAEDDDTEIAEDDVKIDGVPAALWQWASMSPDEIGADDAASLQPDQPSDR